MAEGFGGVVKGVKECEAALAAMDKRVDIATTASVAKVAATARTSVRSGMRGRPRWDRRGNGRGGPAVNLNLSPHHSAKGGSVGKLDGALVSSVVKSKKPRPEPGGASAVVFVGGARANPQVNFYKGRYEGEYHYFAKGIDKAKKKVPAVFEAAWAKATTV